MRIMNEKEADDVEENMELGLEAIEAMMNNEIGGNDDYSRYMLSYIEAQTQTPLIPEAHLT